MVSPEPVNPPIQTAQPPEGPGPGSGGAVGTRFLRSYGFHVLAVLLGIALAFM